MLNRQETELALKRQLSLDLNCAISDFDSDANIITVPAIRHGRREYIRGAFFFSMATMGKNAVISADGALHSWLRDYAASKPGHYLFEHGSLMEIEGQLAPHGKRLSQSHHMFLPRPGFIEVRAGVKVRWYETDDIMGLYGGGFPNALCKEFDPKRPDMLAVAALDKGGDIMGLAGCSADCPDMWQIGIDVFPAFRGRGIATALVSLLRNEILKRGYIPFYGTSLSNLHSWNVALNSGFYPAWVEIVTVEED